MPELRDGSGNRVTRNDDWESDQSSAIQASGYAPPKEKESAILATLQPTN